MTTLTQVIDATVAALRAQIPDVPTIEADPPPQTQRAVRVPAIYVELADIDPVSNPGDTRTLVDARFEARCIVDPTLPRAHLAVRELAARVLRALQEIRRPLPGHGHLRPMRAGDDAFRPELDGYLVWVVEWSVEIALGELDADTLPPPSEIYLSGTPAEGA